MHEPHKFRIGVEIRYGLMVMHMRPLDERLVPMDKVTVVDTGVYYNFYLDAYAMTHPLKASTPESGFVQVLRLWDDEFLLKIPRGGLVYNQLPTIQYPTKGKYDLNRFPVTDTYTDEDDIDSMYAEWRQL